MVIFSYFSMKTFFVGIHWKRLVETLPMNTHKMFSVRNKKLAALIFLKNWTKLIPTVLVLLLLYVVFHLEVVWIK